MNKKINILRAILIILLLIMFGTIFNFSNQNGDKSGSLSREVTENNLVTAYPLLNRRWKNLYRFLIRYFLRKRPEPENSSDCWQPEYPRTISRLPASGCPSTGRALSADSILSNGLLCRKTGLSVQGVPVRENITASLSSSVSISFGFRPQK